MGLLQAGDDAVLLLVCLCLSGSPRMISVYQSGSLPAPSFLLLASPMPAGHFPVHISGWEYLYIWFFLLDLTHAMYSPSFTILFSCRSSSPLPVILSCLALCGNRRGKFPSLGFESFPFPSFHPLGNLPCMHLDYAFYRPSQL